MKGLVVVFGLLTAGASIDAAMQPSFAQDRSQTIHLILPIAPGGSGDGLSRVLADRMRSTLGQTVIVENRAGGASRIGLTAVKLAPPDGTTLLLTQMAPMTLFPHVYKALDYDPVKDFTPISQVATFSFGLAVGNDVPAQTPAELLAWLKSHPDKATFGGPGSGGLPHFFGLLFGRAAGVDMTHVAYKGTANAITDLLGGQIPMIVALASDLAPLHKEGRLRVIATTDVERWADLPDVPTMKESGLDIAGAGWFGVYAPANTPAAVVERLNKVIVEAINTPDVQSKIRSIGLKPTGTSAQELARLQATDLAKWGPVIKAAGLTFE